MSDSSGHEEHDVVFYLSDYRLDMPARESDAMRRILQTSSAASFHGQPADGKAAAKERRPVLPLA